MPTSTNVTNLKINELTEAQYDTAVSGGVIGANELSILTDVDEAIQVSTMPTAGADELGKVYQFIGTTDANYTHGYFYECTGAGEPVVYSWSRVDVQPSSSYTAGTGIDITSGVISVTIPTLTNTGTGTDDVAILGTTGSSSGGNNIVIGKNAKSSTSGANSIVIGPGANTGSVANASRVIVIGTQAKASGLYATSIGWGATTTAQNAIQLGSVGVTSATNSDDNTVKIANANGNFEMMSADGTIPTARLTKVNSTITLTSAGWSSNTQTVNVTGMTATGVVFVSPDPTDQADYTSAGIVCSAQAAGTLTFTCDTVPSGDIDVNVVML